MKSCLLLWSALVSTTIALSATEATYGQTANSLEGDRLSKWQPVEQPLGVKASVAAIAAGLVSLELWWFLLGSRQNQKRTAESGQLDSGTDGDAASLAEGDGLPLSNDNSKMSIETVVEIAIVQGYIDAMKGIAMVEDRLVPRFSAFVL